MKTLFIGDVADREFGRRGVRVADLQAWAASKGAALPTTVPDVAGFDVAHLEGLLCAIGAGVRLTFRVQEIQAAVEVASRAQGRGDFPLRLPPEPKWLLNALISAAQAVPHPDPRVRADIDEGDHHTAAFHLAGHLSEQWRDVLRAAISAGELATVDALSGLPDVPAGGPKESEDAALLRRFRELGGEVIRDKLTGRRGALAALATEDGRHRNTLRDRIRRAARTHEGASTSLNAMARTLTR